MSNSSVALLLKIACVREGMRLSNDADEFMLEEYKQIAQAFFALLGIIIFTSMIGVRHDMLMYARTVNEIRGYFSKKYTTIQPHLVLPTSSSMPSFWETPLKYFFWEVTIVGLVNSSLITFALVLLNLIQVPSLSLSEMGNIVMVIIFFVIIHHLWYFLLSYLRQREFEQSRKIGTTQTEKGQN
jgi:hypothetical protein